MPSAGKPHARLANDGSEKESMLKEHLVISLKMTVGVVLAVLLAQALNMEFYMSAATIVIVSMLSAKKQSIKLAATRLLAALGSLVLATALFSGLGFSLAVFALYILIFTFLMHKFDTKVAIVLNVVLVMHIYALKELSLPILMNEFGLMFLGISVALAINLFIIDIEAELIGYQKKVEDLFQSIFSNMGKCLENQCKIDVVRDELNMLEELLSLAKDRAFKYMNNYYIQENNYFVEYFGMRKQQYYIVKSMQKFLKLKFLAKKEVELLKDYTDNFVNNTKALNTCESQKKILEDIKHHFSHEAELPTTLSQLQNRIALHQYLYSLDDLVSVKMRFIERHEMK